MKTVSLKDSRLHSLYIAEGVKNDLCTDICRVSEKQIRERKSKPEETIGLNAKIGFLIALIVTAIIGVYGIELGIRVSTGSGRPEYLAVVLIVIVLLLLVDLRFYRGYKRDKKKK